jgi:hypothetical protein
MIKEMSGVGGGAIAGAGIDAPGKPGSGEPGVSPKHQAKNKSPILYPEMMRRTVPNMVKETQLDELSKKTLSNYIKKASDNRAKNQGDFDFYYKKKNSKKYGKAFRNVLNRRKGIRTATDKLVKEETFAGAAIFEVSSKLFHNITLQKRKGKHWRTYLEEDDCYAEIREWARKHPKGKIVVRNESTGEMRYVRY